jgi:hypothetical protein
VECRDLCPEEGRAGLDDLDGSKAVANEPPPGASPITPMTPMSPMPYAHG